MTIRARTRTLVAVAVVIAGAVLGVSCFSGYEGPTSPVLALTDAQQNDSVMTWRQTLMYPSCPYVVGQVLYVSPLERAVGATVTFQKGKKTFLTHTNRNGQFRVAVDTGRLAMTIEHRGVTLMRDSVHPPMNENNASRIFSLTTTRDGRWSLISEASPCLKQPGYVDSLISEPRR